MNLTPAEIGLVRTVLTHLAEAKWELHRYCGEWRSPDGLTAFRIDGDLQDRPAIQLATKGRVGFGIFHFTRPYVRELQPSSVEHAVDGLVWLGVLPAELHSAYRAGVEIGMDSVTDITIEHLMDAELDKLSEGGDELAALLDKGPVTVLESDDPWLRRDQVAAIIGAVEKLLGRAA